MPQTKDERKEKKRLAERKRMENIRKDPEKYALWKSKMKEIYMKRKREGKIVSVKNLSAKQQKIARKKSRESTRRWYAKKKLKECDIHSEDEIIDECDPVDNIETNDPLDLEIPSSTEDPTILRPPEIPSSSQVLTQSSPTARITRSTIKQKRTIEIDLNLTESETDVSSNAKAPSRKLKSPSPNTSISDYPRTPSPQSSVATSPRRVVSPKVYKPARETSVKKKSPWKHILRKFQYRYNKELQLKDQKILELKRANENYRKKIKRLQTAKQVKNVDKKQKKTLSGNENGQLVVETLATGIKESVTMYFEEDENSRMCAGKKEFITKGKVRKQKRYLTDSLQNLHKKYLEANPQYKISYSAFCKLRPFWVRVPNVNIRETCLCKDHENMELVVVALRKNDLIKEKSVNEILESLCCDPRNVRCLAKNCDLCKNKVISYKEFDNSKETHYWIWKKVKKTYIKDGKEKATIQTIKEKVAAHPKDIIKYFENLLVPYMRHCGNIIAQYNYTKNLKQNLKPEECIIHCDFSENYNTKYASEIQSFHFGSSRQQLTLHTSVVYYIKDGKLHTQSYCTISECLRHDAVAIWEHLQPILRFLENEVPGVTTFHFLTDSPSAQYRNRKMFYIMAKMHWYFPSLRLLVWNYSEKGHGKGAPDGVGGVLKRTADQIVARGNDIPNIEILIKHLKERCHGVIIEVIHESGILEKDMLIPDNLKEFRGTMRIHQVVWSANQLQTLAMRELSCSLGNCSQEAIQCSHGQHIGFYTIEDINRQQNDKNNKSANKRQVKSKKVTCSSLMKRNQTSVTQNHSGKDSDTAQQDLDLPADDSFWMETSSIDEQIITPKFTSDILSTLHQNSSESDDEDIFVFKKPECDKITKESHTAEKNSVLCKKPRKYFL